MWSQTKKALECRLADSLRERVYYSYAEYTSKKYKWWCSMPVFYIRVDGKTWFATNPLWYKYQCKFSNEYYKSHTGEYWELHSDAWEFGDNSAIKEFGSVGSPYELMPMIHKFLNVYNIDDCLNHENYFYRLLAVLDRRMGKRRIKALLDDIGSEPEWLRKYIILRAEAEGII